MSMSELATRVQLGVDTKRDSSRVRSNSLRDARAKDNRQKSSVGRSDNDGLAPGGSNSTFEELTFAGQPYVKVLVVEDDVELLSALKRYLNEKHFLVTTTDNGSEAVTMLLDSDETYGAVILDIMLPGLDGREVCRQVRGAGCWVPIVMVTALGETEDRITGLERGADDYLVKPFSLEELSLRLRALIRRSEATWISVLQLGELRVNLQSRQSWRGDVELSLTHREFQLLEFFLRHPGLVLSRNTIRSAVWGVADNKAISDNLIDHHIAHLRKKIDRPSLTSYIETLSRIGYRLRTSESG